LARLRPKAKLRLEGRKVLMSTHQDEPGHGNSIAAWTAVIVSIVGVTILTWGYMVQSDVLMYVGGAVTVLSIVVGPVLAKLGYGVAGKSSK
jgi:hypothetical protein